MDFLEDLQKLSRDTWLMLVSRITRSFSAGFLAVIIGLYYLYACHLSPFLIGILFSAGAIGSPVLVMIFSRYADMYGRKQILLLTLSFLPIAIAILLLTTYYPLLLISAALGGFGVAGGLVGGGVGAAVAPMQNALLAEKTEKGMLTFVYTFFTIVSSFSGALGALLAHISDYMLLFEIGFVISLISLLSVIPIREKFKGSKRTQGSKKSKKKLKSMSTIKKFIYTGALNGFGMGLITPFLPIVFSIEFHMSNGSIGDLFALGGIISSIAMFSTPYFTAKYGFVNFIIVSRTISAVFILILPFSRLIIEAMLFYIIFTALRVIALPTQQALMMELIDASERSTASGYNQTARLVPSSIATSISGYLLKVMPVFVPFVITFPVNIINAFLYHHYFDNVSPSKKVAISAE